MIPATITRAPSDHPSPPLVEADAELLRLFDAWYAAEPEDRAATGHALIERLWRYRGRWMLAPEHVFYLTTSDNIRVLPRTMIYPRKEQAQ